MINIKSSFVKFFVFTSTIIVEGWSLHEFMVLNPPEVLLLKLWEAISEKKGLDTLRSHRLNK